MYTIDAWMEREILNVNNMEYYKQKTSSKLKTCFTSLNSHYLHLQLFFNRTDGLSKVAKVFL